MTAQKIDQCPFCRDEALAWKIRENAVTEFWYVFCNECGARGPRAGTEIGAVTLWNARRRETDEDVVRFEQEEQSKCHH